MGEHSCPSHASWRSRVSLFANNQCQHPGVRNRARTSTPEFPHLGTDIANTYHVDTATLNWLLYDFGSRAAATENARLLLQAAQGQYDQALLKVFANTARDYYLAAAAQSALEVAVENEQTTQQTLKAASGRVTGGVAAITDQLQAQTAYTQAMIGRIKAEGEQHNALGVLALDMGLPINQLRKVVALQRTAANIDQVEQAISVLLGEAQREHPALKAARLQRDAARARVEQVRAEGRPSISLVARASHNTQPESLGVGLSTTPARSQDRYLGIELNVPIFEGFGRTYKIRSAEAEVELQEARLSDAEQQVARDIWTSHEALRTASLNVGAIGVLLRNAEAAFTASQKRYRTGIADIMELMGVQTALANARQQKVQAIADWYTAKYQLAAALGRVAKL
ncbi:TolC family protein [Paludibacterium sp. dN 18-1]|uniref:TolC family protein n=1 Tax=Paludibacterium denitrificans TaxID=2675226 RepID=A0A844GHR9_9NEIS|nr:TolC family protein [Paludibacterium denitrificans]